MKTQAGSIARKAARRGVAGALSLPKASRCKMRAGMKVQSSIDALYALIFAVCVLVALLLLTG
jgi:hypothetical protein